VSQDNKEDTFQAVSAGLSCTGGTVHSKPPAPPQSHSDSADDVSANTHSYTHQIFCGSSTKTRDDLGMKNSAPSNVTCSSACSWSFAIPIFIISICSKNICG